MASETYIAPFVTAFLVLQLSGATIFAFVVLSACIFRGAKRHPIWFSFCVSWIIFGLSYSLLLLTGQQFKTPARVPCTIQSSLIYAAPFLVMGSTLGLVVHLLLNVLSALSRSPKKKQHLTIVQTLVVLPWMIWVAVLVGVLVYGFSHDGQISMSRNGTYCVIHDSSIPKVTSVSATIASSAIIAVEVAIGIHLYHSRGIVNIFSQAMAMALRIFIFTILGCGALAVGLVFAVTSTRGVQFDLILAILPPAAALTFGTQLDLLKGWLFWKKSTPAIPDHTSLTLTTVNSISSQSTPSIRRASIISRRPSQAASIHQVQGPPDVSSFLHF